MGAPTAAAARGAPVAAASRGTSASAGGSGDLGARRRFGLPPGGGDLNNNDATNVSGIDNTMADGMASATLLANAMAQPPSKEAPKNKKKTDKTTSPHQDGAAATPAGNVQHNDDQLQGPSGVNGGIRQMIEKTRECVRSGIAGNQPAEDQDEGGKAAGSSF